MDDSCPGWKDSAVAIAEAAHSGKVRVDTVHLCVLTLQSRAKGRNQISRADRWIEQRANCSWRMPCQYRRYIVRGVVSFHEAAW